MDTSRLKSGQRAPPSVTQNFFAQLSRQAHTAQACLFELLIASSPDGKKERAEFLRSPYRFFSTADETGCWVFAWALSDDGN